LIVNEVMCGWYIGFVCGGFLIHVGLPEMVANVVWQTVSHC
jgi:hypothetical protein